MEREKEKETPREQAARTRIGVTITKPYLDALNHLVENGIYRSKGEVVLEALRILLGRHGIEPFSVDEIDHDIDE